MSLPIADTPIAAAVTLPAARDSAWNASLEPALIPAPGTAAILERLRQRGALVVTTGQQPGLFTGPSYCVSKALSARALALALERRWNRPVVPVYWVPGDDHDLHEVAGASWLNADGGLVSVALEPRAPEAPLTPLWREPLGQGVVPLLDSFERSFSPGSADAIVTLLRRHYRPEATVAGAFGGALAELLAPFGVLCFDSTHPAAKQASAPLILRALEHGAALDRALGTEAARLQGLGRDPGVPVGDGASLGFLDGPLGRDRLVTDGDGFLTRRGRRPVSLAELGRIAEQEPTRLSGNVLLRPALESALLPTVAYLAGPAELRYLELAAPVYTALEIPRQLPLPRWSGLLIEPRVTRVLTKFGTTIEALLAEGTELEARVAREALPEGTERVLADLRDAIVRHYEPVIGAARGVDPTLERPAAAARGRALHDLQVLEKKLGQHARQRASVELSQIAKARLSVRPAGKPQERLLAMTGFVARYGPEVIGSLAAHIEAWYARMLEAAPGTA